VLDKLEPGMWIYSKNDYSSLKNMRRYWVIEKVEKDAIDYIYFGFNVSRLLGKRSLMMHKKSDNFSLIGLERLTKSRATIFKKTLIDIIFKGRLQVIE
jgi:hypothetical protein